jgi:pimeloyl-[acyl-carrier protein] synthase
MSIGLADPYPEYRERRQQSPVFFDETRGGWMVYRHADVETVLRDTERFSADQGLPPSMLVSDPPAHTRLRGLVSKAFTARRVQELAPRIEGIVERLLDAAAARGEMDVIADFAYPLPITVIAELLGVEPEKRDFFREASQKIALSLGYVDDPGRPVEAMSGRNDLLWYLEGLIHKRRSDPKDDLISALIAAEDRGDFLNRGELLAMLLLLLVGGHETTVNLIGNGLLALIQHPDQLELLRDNDAIAASAIEELLRYDTSVQYSGRVARCDVELSGVKIGRGERVRAIIGAANRDPEVFAGPDRLDLTRTPNPHLAFGVGIHYCLGAQLARLEGRIALTALVRRSPRLRLTGDVRWRPAPVLRGLELFPVEF